MLRPTNGLRVLVRACHSAGGPRAGYDAATSSGYFRPDPMQLAALDHLEKVYARVSTAHTAAGPAGVYLHGPVGSGKTALMDLLLQSCRGAGASCRRLHFHELMEHAHRQMHKKRAPPEIGADLAAEASLVCLDEMALTDIADAAIVTRLLEGCVSGGAAVVTTSNRRPEELYWNGLNRHVYIPGFCEMLGRRGVVVHELQAEGDTDYRARRADQGTRRKAEASAVGGDVSGDGAEAAAGGARYHWPADGAAAAAIRRSFEARGGALGRVRLPLGESGRRGLDLPLANRVGCVVSFATLCGSALGAADYLELARRYELLAVEGVPALTPEDHNAARRFITLIDVWYDQGKELPPLAASPWTWTASLHASSCEQELHLSSAVPLPQLFSGMHEEGMRASLGSLSTYAQADPVPAATSVRGFGGASAGLTSTWMGDGTEWSATGLMGVSMAALNGLQDAAFAQRRAASRLLEMSAADSWPPPARSAAAGGQDR
ncbi:mitochondrial ATPase [Emiliania huxleyi CCMP1516]|uniref:AAA+ ATPase domain-containing protein n=2 Tax=Emiliania huxleyi TaxID=2903 RepID=A0A0D3KW31_EMIH1|nr:mitochondrial ATPase [Emiliania huxleyi CCMP1516]EOD39966.1 mitochondrial ATPase [Emiliania huxleyi CCMP1516]|eukprot:XP_005792395.1 mitochondrial ATPase [Emiliania huxleyi CCMP1516]